MSKWWSHRVVQGFLLQYPMQAAKLRWLCHCVAWWESQVSLCVNESIVYVFTYINLEPGFFGVYLIYIYILMIQNTYILHVVVCLWYLHHLKVTPSVYLVVWLMFFHFFSSDPPQKKKVSRCFDCSWRPCLSTFAQNGDKGDWNQLGEWKI